MKPTVAIRQGARFLPYGLVSGFEVELGYFSLTEIEGIRGSLGLPVERDLYFNPASLRELQRQHIWRMQKEIIPLQIDLFTGEPIDARTRTQKQIDKEQDKPQQIEMFAQREVAQFGVRANPHFPLSEHTRLVLIQEDPRTEEEKERDRIREAERLTDMLFPVSLPAPTVKVEDKPKNDTPTLLAASRPAQIVGFRALHRRLSASVRTRTGC